MLRRSCSRLLAWPPVSSTCRAGDYCYVPLCSLHYHLQRTYHCYDDDGPTDLDTASTAEILYLSLYSCLHTLDPGPNLRGSMFSRSSLRTLAMSNCYLQSFQFRRDANGSSTWIFTCAAKSLLYANWFSIANSHSAPKYVHNRLYWIENHQR